MLADIVIRIPSGVPTFIGWIVIVVVGIVFLVILLEIIFGFFYPGN